MNETTKEGLKGARYQCLVKDDLNVEEATAIGDEVAEVSVEDECQVRESNTCKFINSIELDLYHLKCLDCKYNLIYWQLLFVSGLVSHHNSGTIQDPPGPS